MIPRAVHASSGRIPLIVALLIVPLLSWWWITSMAHDMNGSMSGASAWMMRSSWDASHLLLLWAMWAAMMAAMMLPSAYPIVVLYRGAALRRSADRPLHVYSLVAGYLSVWAAFSVGATVLQRLLTRALVLSRMMELSTPRAAAIVLLVAGAYQLTPLKRVCLGACRSPMNVLMQHWREGRGGALRMGAAHGLYCVGCCWSLMLLLFVGGVMNLATIAALTMTVAVEKLGPFGIQGARVSGVVLLAAGALLLIVPSM
jgi:predicted metal-binding membrane protein